VDGIDLSFDTVDFDQTGYVQDGAHIEIQSTSTFILNGVASWDTTGESGTRTLTLLVNGVPTSTASADITSADPYTVQFSALLDLNLGDVLQVQASHSLLDSQNLLAGTTFLGLVDPNAAPEASNQAAAAPVVPTGMALFNSGVEFPIYTAVSISSDGNVYPVNPATALSGSSPLVDGVAFQASTAAGTLVLVAISYGTVFSTPNQNWTVGGLLYVAANGALTQDFSSVASQNWVICVGKAVTTTSFLYEPHLPTTNSVAAASISAENITGIGPAPTIVLGLDAVVGTGATVSLQPGSNAIAGQILFQSGSGTLFVGAALILTINCATAAPNRQIFTVTAGNLAATQCQPNAGASDATAAQLDTMVGLVANTAYIFNYTLTQI
jgi:hypothetical protein